MPIDFKEIAELAEKYKNISPIELPFRISHLAPEKRRALAEHIAGKEKAQYKIPSWHQNNQIIFPAQLYLSQSSSEKTALFKSKLLTGKTLIDLTGGLGVDTWAFAQQFEKVWYVEKNSEIYRLAQHNLKSLGLHNVELHNQTAEEFLMAFPQKVDTIYLDPSRRNPQGKAIAQIHQTEPNILQLLPLLFQKTQKVLLKASPMFDIHQALKLLVFTTKVFVISWKNECKEILYLLENKTSALSVTQVPIHTYNLLENSVQHFSATTNEEQNATVSYCNQIHKYLYEPNSSILKAGFFKLISEKFALQKLHPSTHLYTKDQIIETFPGRVFEIQQNLTELKKFIANRKQINVLVRNVPFSVEEFYKKHHLKEGGTEWLIICNTYPNQKVALYARRVQ